MTLPMPALVIAFTGLLAGCATPAWLCVNPSGASNVTIVADPAMNDTRAVAIDLVLVTNPDAAGGIAGLSARDWFERRAQLRRDWPEGLRIQSWELTPGQAVVNARAEARCDTARTLVFADYATPGDHRAQLGGAASARIVLGPRDLSVEQR